MEKDGTFESANANAVSVLSTKRNYLSEVLKSVNSNEKKKINKQTAGTNTCTRFLLK